MPGLRLQEFFSCAGMHAWIIFDKVQKLQGPCMENFVKTFLHLVKTYKIFPASWKILKEFSCVLKKDPAVYKKNEKVQAIGRKNSCAIQIKKPKNRHFKRNRNCKHAHRTATRLRILGHFSSTIVCRWRRAVEEPKEAVITVWDSLQIEDVQNFIAFFTKRLVRVVASNGAALTSY